MYNKYRIFPAIPGAVGPGGGSSEGAKKNNRQSRKEDKIMLVKCPCCQIEYDVEPDNVYRCVCNTKFTFDNEGNITILEQGQVIDLTPPEGAAVPPPAEAEAPAAAPAQQDGNAPQGETIQQVAATVQQVAATVQQVAATVQQVAEPGRPKSSPYGWLWSLIKIGVVCAALYAAVYAVWNYHDEIRFWLGEKLEELQKGGSAPAAPEAANGEQTDAPPPPSPGNHRGTQRTSRPVKHSFTRPAARPADSSSGRRATAPGGGGDGIGRDIARGIIFSGDRQTLRRYNTSLTDREYTVPDGVRTIGRRAFAESESLEFVMLPDGLTTIEDGAFEDCEKLRHVVLPRSLRRIGRNAFRGAPCEETVRDSRPDLF